MTMLVPLAMALLNSKGEDEPKRGSQYVKMPTAPTVGQPPPSMGSAIATTRATVPGNPYESGPHDELVRDNPYMLGADPKVQQPPVMGQTTAPGPPMETWGNAGADRPDLDYYGGIYHRSPWEDGNG